MPKETMYVQCSLVKRDREHPDIRTEQVSWIPEKFAVVGKVLKLKDSAGNWDDGWVVESAGGEKRPESVANYHSRDYLRTRKNSNI